MVLHHKWKFDVLRLLLELQFFQKDNYLNVLLASDEKHLNKSNETVPPSAGEKPQHIHSSVWFLFVLKLHQELKFSRRPVSVVLQSG